MSVSHYVPHVVEIMHGPGYSRTHISHAHCLLATHQDGGESASILRAANGCGLSLRQEQGAFLSKTISGEILWSKHVREVDYCGHWNVD